ncbi:UDP-galactose 4-epimerase [Idiomarina loihiensis]|uniref:UDP-glucose 4-epimerase GalE n=1 Tax=Idiomarina TaxID=135575 RepID=UPI000D719D0D|nr:MULTISPECIES: UDP-glucose 4-epimerase GalE [Idiomarina]PWW40393.1 UDP-galactose 4-epimerase [Idiomarina loihiensis]TDP50084.1 UDP-galactose 4-epimerase [Idiomarina loihiensis]TDS24564.1 UDP-galactose 4-epimerase [Idiomarina sp. H2]
MKKQILVTGGCGFIGSHTVIELILSGYQVIVVDDLSNSNASVIDKIHSVTGERPDFHQIDICDRNALTNLFKQYAFDAVMHFAALKNPQESYHLKEKYFLTNVEGTRRLLAVMEDCSVNHLIFSSSAVVYGNPSCVPVAESAPAGAVTNPYGETKYRSECDLAEFCEKNLAFSAISLRYFNPGGAHPSGVIGEQPIKPAANLIPAIGNVITRKTDSVQVYGCDYSTCDGTAIRDYIHVCDVAKGHVAALEAGFARTGHHIFNLGTGKGESVLGVIHAFEQASGQIIPVNFSERRQGDVASCYAQADKALQELNWKVEHDLQTIARDYCHWLSLSN